MSDSNYTLRNLFATAKEAQEQLDMLDARTEEYKAKLRATVSSYEECQKLVVQASMFSPNEEVDDIASGDLQYSTPHLVSHPPG